MSLQLALSYGDSDIESLSCKLIGDDCQHLSIAWLAMVSVTH